MGGCCCCCGSGIDAGDPSVSAHLLTTRYMRHGPRRQKYKCPTPRAVYVREDKLYFESCTCVAGGYPLERITSADVVRGATILVGHRGLFLNPGIRVKGNDGTVIAFSAPNSEVDMFVLQLRSSVAAVKERRSQSTSSNAH